MRNVLTALALLATAELAFPQTAPRPTPTGGRAPARATPASGSSVAASGSSVAPSAPARSTQQVSVEVVSADQSGQTITVRQPSRLNVATTSTPEDTSIVTLPVQTEAVAALRNMRNGQEVVVTCLTTTPLTGAGAAGNAGTLGGTAAGNVSGTLGGTAAGNVSGTLGGTAAGNVSGGLGGSVAAQAGAPAGAPAPSAPVTAPTNTPAPSSGNGVRPLSLLQGNCSVIALH
jgi:hypothetical protein